MDGMSAAAPVARGEHSRLFKLLWLSGYLPHLAGCAACGEEKPLVGFSAQAGGGVCAECGSGAVAVPADGFEAVRGFLERTAPRVG